MLQSIMASILKAFMVKKLCLQAIFGYPTTKLFTDKTEAFIGNHNMIFAIGRNEKSSNTKN